MKIRIRIRSRTEKVEVGNDPSDNKTLGDLISAVAHITSLEPGSFQLSLNGKEPINGSPEEPLSSFGIVAGDLIKVLLPDGVGLNEATASSGAGTRPDTRVNGSINTSRETTAGSSSPQASASNTENRLDLPDSESRPNGNDARGGRSGAEASAVDIEMTEEEKEAREQLEQLEKETQGEAISEPMLCRDAEDGKIPLLLRQLCQENSPTGLGDILCLALHVLMVETGFNIRLNEDENPYSASSAMECQQEEKDEENQPTCLPLDWKTNTSYRLHYQHPECHGLSCAVAAISFSSTTLLVHGLIGKQIQSSTQLKLTSFASFDGEGHVMYKNLPLLSRTFKDTIAYPLLAIMREELGLPPLHGLIALVPEIQLKILSFLQLPDLMTMSTVSRHFCNLANDRSLWRQMVLRDYGGKNTDRHCNWKSVYKEKFRMKKLRDQLRSRIQRNFYPPGRRPFAFLPPLPNPLPGIYPPGYIGGDYDINPFRSGGALPGLPGPGFQPIPGPIVPGPRHDPIFPNPAANPRPGFGGGLRDPDAGRPHPYAPQQPQGFPMMPSRRTGGGRAGGGNLRGFFR